MAVPLTTFLQERNIPFQVSRTGRCVVVGKHLDLEESGVTELPRALVVHGNLDLSRTGISRLPDRLKVRGGLFLQGLPITELPRVLHVDGDLQIMSTGVRTLPAGLRVQGHLDLRHTPIHTLPDRLHVAGDLLLWGSGITAFPSCLHVGGCLLSPATLNDAQRFMAAQDHTVTWARSTSAHAQLALREQLRPFPDLWMIVDHLSPGVFLCLEKNQEGEVQARIRTRKSPDS